MLRPGLLTACTTSRRPQRVPSHHAAIRVGGVLLPQRGPAQRGPQTTRALHLLQRLQGTARASHRTMRNPDAILINSSCLPIGQMKWGLARLTSWLYKSDSDPFVFPRPAEIEYMRVLLWLQLLQPHAVALEQTLTSSLLRCSHDRRDQLQHITEAATLLVMDKAVFAKPQAVRRQFVELSGPQLRALLFNFRPDAYVLPSTPGDDPIFIRAGDHLVHTQTIKHLPEWHLRRWPRSGRRRLP